MNICRCQSIVQCVKVPVLLQDGRGKFVSLEASCNPASYYIKDVWMYRMSESDESCLIRTAVFQYLPGATHHVLSSY